MKWLVSDSLAADIEQAMSTEATPEAIAFGDSVEAAGKSLRVENGVARISIAGLLVKKRQWWMAFIGTPVTAYGDIINAITLAENDPRVSKVQFDVDSSGGQVDGVFNAVAAMQMMKKPTEAVVDGTSASAAYLLASQAGLVKCLGPVCNIGSIGVVVSVGKSENGITSTKAPFKRVDAETEEGRAHIVAYLDDIHELFTDAVATGRNVSKTKIDKDFGQGGIMLSQAALKAGMVDEVIEFNTKEKEGAKAMDLNELKANHPALVEQIRAEERKRVSDHILLATTIEPVEADTAFSVALEAIKNGTPYADCQAQYDAIGMRKRLIVQRQEETPELEEKAPAAVNENKTSLEDAAYQAALENLGVNLDEEE